MKNYKNIKKNRDSKKFKRKLIFKHKKKQINKIKLGLNKEERKEQHFLYFEQKSYVKIKSPTILSLVKYPEETICFINKIKKHQDLGNKVFIRLTHVTEVGYDALVVLLSIMISFKTKKIGFNGNFPNNPTAKKVLIESGFFEYLYKNIKDEDRYNLIKGGSISTHASKKVESLLGHEVISEATKFIWKKKRRCQGVQRLLVELMHNTNNHASFTSSGKKHWFLSIQHIKEENKVCFSFIDFGVGIFKSLNNKGKKSKWYDWRDSLSKIFTFKNNKELLKLILNGELHKTVTGKYYRGKGLPGIYQSYKNNDLSKLHIISNDVFSNIENNKFSHLDNHFSGTFVYWELNDKNNNINGID